MDLKFRKMLLIIFFVPLFVQASSSPYPQLIELTGGKIWQENGPFNKVGEHWEYFPENFDHHLSFGLASEMEFEERKEFYGGPELSLHFDHVKYFVSAGFQGDDTNWRMKTRTGVGYEFHIQDDLILVPNLTANYFNEELHPGLSLGLTQVF